MVDSEDMNINRRTASIAVFLLLCVACVAHAFYYYPRLPAEVAHHFGASGQPNAWGSKMSFLVIYLVTVVITAATFLGVAFLMPILPNSALNFPNKEYWLAPERRQKALDYMMQQLLWMGSLTLILLLDIFHQSVQVHLGKATRLSHFWVSMGVYLTLTIVWCVAICREFRKKALSGEK